MLQLTRQEWIDAWKKWGATAEENPQNIYIGTSLDPKTGDTNGLFAFTSWDEEKQTIILTHLKDERVERSCFSGMPDTNYRLPHFITKIDSKLKRLIYEAHKDVKLPPLRVPKTSTATGEATERSEKSEIAI